MKWLPFAILAVITLVLQTSLVPALAIHGIRPDWMFILAVHYALWARWPDAGLAAWILGLLLALESTERIGLHALCYGLAAWGIFRVRQALFRDHPVTQIVVTFVAALAVEMLVAVYRWWAAPVSGVPLGLWPALLTALYTAACAPYLHWLFLRLSRWSGLRSAHDMSPHRA